MHLSKSKYLWGQQCAKLLWHAYHAQNLFPPTDALRSEILDQGQAVGRLARNLFPQGIEIGPETVEIREAVKQTRESLQHRKALFEAAFTAENCHCRVDILAPAQGSHDAWDLIEVKSATRMHDVHLKDLAYQVWVLRKAGIQVAACRLLHVNADYVRQGEIDVPQFLASEDVTPQAMALQDSVESAIMEQFKTIRQTTCPDIKIGRQCDDPYECPLHDRCWSFLPDHHVVEIYRDKQKGFDLLSQGIQTIAEIPVGAALTENQRIQQQAVKTGKPQINKTAISNFLGLLKPPFSYLDFETFGTAIPYFDNTRPYEQIPFQFSLHVVAHPEAKPSHHSFLAQDAKDPRLQFLARLKECLPPEGSIIAYNAAFELNCLESCCKAHPEFEQSLADVKSRMVDLLQPFRAFHYYHPLQHGSASMKRVLPAMTGKTYKHLAIQEGSTASQEFLRVTFTDVPEQERKLVRRQLEEYCGLDTMGMVWITDALRECAA